MGIIVYIPVGQYRVVRLWGEPAMTWVLDVWSNLTITETLVRADPTVKHGFGAIAPDYSGKKFYIFDEVFKQISFVRNEYNGSLEMGTYGAPCSGQVSSPCFH